METVAVPHRGRNVATIGALSLVVALLSFQTGYAWLILLPLGLTAWIRGTRDLRAMDAGVMDPTGRSLTRAGQLMGKIGTAIWIMLGVLTLFTVSDQVFK